MPLDYHSTWPGVLLYLTVSAAVIAILGFHVLAPSLIRRLLVDQDLVKPSVRVRCRFLPSGGIAVVLTAASVSASFARFLNDYSLAMLLPSEMNALVLPEVRVTIRLWPLIRCFITRTPPFSLPQAGTDATASDLPPLSRPSNGGDAAIEVLVRGTAQLMGAVREHSEWASDTEREATVAALRLARSDLCVRTSSQLVNLLRLPLMLHPRSMLG